MPKIVDHAARRKQIMCGAHDLFIDRGYHNVSMRLLASTLSVSTGTLYHYFPSKEALFEALVSSRAESDLRLATQGLSADASPDDRLAQLSQFVLQHHAQLRDTLALVLDHERVQPDASNVAKATLAIYRIPLVLALGPHAGELGLALILGMLVKQMLDGITPDVRVYMQALNGLRQTTHGHDPAK
ncbi:MAG: AcrR family transcriptional regulator [Kiritimatiellia bacterium]|jgi:AcrR family transcriptional regulator